ncbi:MAG: 4-hydroxy-tetrahydrodipicolinate reductase, partial [Gemmataceae bacterium]
MKTIIGINGAGGRMGQRIAQLAREDSDLDIGVALEAAGHPALGKDLGEIIGTGKLGVPLVSSIPLEKRIDAVIDFSLPAGTMAVLPTCVQRRIPLVVATTGHSPEEKADILEGAHETAILMAPNMSLAVNVLFKLVATAGTLLKDKGFDVEILERHHRFKKDSPSGTALHFARIVQEAMGQTDLRHGREGLVGERPATEIGVHAIRVGDNV